MHPALSVIFFTTLSGLGYGIWIWVGLRLAFGPAPDGFLPLGIWLLLIAGAVLTAVGLLSSFWHLGKPLRAWRAFSQWRTSWLSREGAMAALCFVPAALLWLAPDAGIPARVLGMLLALCALVTVACTAMIYASLKPIPAWRHHLVLPVYLGFAVLGGGLAWLAMAGGGAWLAGLLAVLALVLIGMKLGYWRDIDGSALPQDRGDAVGLPGRGVRVFEHPHTEANYLTREMGFVVARRHARTLRLLMLLCLATVPIGMLLLAAGLLAPGAWLWLLPAAVLLGSVFERWLFFAQARHLVMLYY
ncbi:MAG: dimethyl sulfoxide reductase anchor subunit [Pseudoxanthomonas suwonensis]|nr:dimethyl sulfoxide reductase anchor subunit [Pseudoxanthomonas suwonensis]